MTKLPSHCCLCGLLCSLEHGGAANAPLSEVFQCPRQSQWLEHAAAGSPTKHLSWDKDITALAQLFTGNGKCLIWIDAADVDTMRAAVQLAQASGATLHVGGTSGTEATHRVLTSEGWLGTSLAEVGTHADLIITLGDCVLTEFPLLRQRFIRPMQDQNRGQWLHLSSQSSPAAADGATASYYWPRTEWYARLSEVACSLQPHGPAITGSAELVQFAAALQQSRNSVWLWDVDEFCDAIDELTIRRLLGISRKLSERGRCSLLALDSQVGRVTADETLLWLTGCRATARYTQQQWVCPPELHENTLDSWAACFDKILFVQAIPNVGPLPNLACSHYLLPTSSLPGFQSPVAATADGNGIPQITSIAAVGIDSSGHLFRGDRGTMFYCQAEPAGQPAGLPTAAAILQAVRGRLVAQERRHDN